MMDSKDKEKLHERLVRDMAERGWVPVEYEEGEATATLIDEILADIKTSAKLEIETLYIRDRIAEKLSGFHRDKIKEIGEAIEARTNSPWEKSHLKAAVTQAICNYDEKRGTMR